MSYSDSSSCCSSEELDAAVLSRQRAMVQSFVTEYQFHSFLSRSSRHSHLDVMTRTSDNVEQRVVVKTVYFPSADIADAELRTLVVLNALHCPYFPVLRDTFTDEANNRLFVFPVYRSMVASDTKDFDSVVRHSMSVIDALQLMHKNGIAHLDIHPANILIDPVSDCVVLIDFGFSLPLKYAGGVYPRRGFRGFMAPELVGGMSIDGSCLDAFAAGMVMLFWLSQSDPVLLATLSCATNGTSIFADNLPNQSVQSLSAAVCTLIDHRQTTQPRNAGLLKIVNGLLLYRITPGQALMSLREFLG